MPAISPGGTQKPSCGTGRPYVNVLIAIGGVSGIVVLLTAIVVIGRGIFKQVNATEENTEAVQGLTKKVDKLSNLYNGHETRLAVLEDRDRRIRGHGPP